MGTREFALTAVMRQVLCIAGALLVLVVAHAAISDQPNPAEPNEPVVVNVSGPTVVGFLWSGTHSQSESDKETIGILQSALADVAKCLKDQNVSVRMDFALVFRLRSDGREETVAIPGNYPRSVGAILARPGVHSEIIYAFRAGSPSQGLLQAASEYFSAPACRPER
jgi:hypothetical protein